MNKWTLGLAAVGVVSLASVASAEEKTNPVQTMLSGTTISGYVDTSAQWNPGTGNANLPGYKFNNSNMADGFNLDVVKLTIEKPLDESQWAAGYKFDMLYGPYASTYNTASAPLSTGTASDFAIQQAYVALRAPVGNGLDFKMGVFNSIIGYETFDAGNDPNWTRSYGHTMEPQTHTGLLAMYKFCEEFGIAAGVADTVGPTINERGNLYYKTTGGADVAETYKTYMGSISLTAPESMGCLAGSTLYAGIVNGFNSGSIGNPASVGGGAANQTSWYAGATVKTPVTGLRVGASFDYLGVSKQPLTGAPLGIAEQPAYANAWAGYVSYQATEKLGLHFRGEYASHNGGNWYMPTTGTSLPPKIVAATATVQYDLWQNVVSRVEFRWDHDASGQNGGQAYGGTVNGIPDRKNAYMLALNVIYKF